MSECVSESVSSQRGGGFQESIRLAVVVVNGASIGSGVNADDSGRNRRDA